MKGASGAPYCRGKTLRHLAASVENPTRPFVAKASANPLVET